MRLPWRHKVRRKAAVEEARRERQISEQRLAAVAPLRVELHEMREENHIRPLLRRLIEESNKE